MFTGIIENLGTVLEWNPKSVGGVLTIKPQKSFAKIKIGESIAINGCCLTVVTSKKNILVFDVSDETMRKTALGDLQAGDTVNLERAMLAGSRFGGHFVLGHVDGVGTVSAIEKGKGSWRFEIRYPKKFATLLIEKGSVTVNGISLTVCDLTAKNFSVYIVPHTLRETNLNSLSIGSRVNLEFDMLGKYILRMKNITK